MTIRECNDNGRNVLVLTGKFLADPRGRGATALREALTGLIAQHVDNVVLDLSGVMSLDAAGLGEIVSAYLTMRRHGGQLRLLSPTAKVQKLLEISRVGTVIPVLESLKEIPEDSLTAA